MRIKITGRGIYGGDGEIPVGAEFEVKEAPRNWAGRYVVLDNKLAPQEKVFVANPAPASEANDDEEQGAGQDDEPVANDDAGNGDPEPAEPTPRDDLKARADALGIKYAKNIPTDKLAVIVAEHEAENV